MSHAIRISKRDFYALGSFRNSNLFRRHTRGGWRYYRVID